MPTQAHEVTVPAVQFQSVSLRYGGGQDALRDVSFTLPRGSFHFLTGASGAGKSSLLSLIQAGRVPSAGQVAVLGQDTGALKSRTRTALRRRMGVVFPDFRLIDHLSAFDNVALPLRVRGQAPAQYGEDVMELLAWVGLRDRAATSPEALSAGEKQRLAIARAVVARPELIIADEPTAAVDEAMALRLLRLFVELNRLGTTVLIATHDQDMVARSGRPVLHLDQGRLTGAAT